jgi:hypothetical protein
MMTGVKQFKSFWICSYNLKLVCLKVLAQREQANVNKLVKLRSYTADLLYYILKYIAKIPKMCINTAIRLQTWCMTHYELYKQSPDSLGESQYKCCILY